MHESGTVSFQRQQRTQGKTFFDPTCWREMECTQNSQFYVYYYLCWRETLVNYELLINLPQLKCPRAEDNGRKNNLNHIM